MAGTELTVVSANAPLARIDLHNLNFEAAERWLDDNAGGNRGAFPGEQISIDGKKGGFRIGFGDKEQTAESLKMVVNAGYMVDAWQFWPGKAPSYPFMALPFAGQNLPSRDSLGHHDQSEWKPNKFKKGEKDDPFKQVIVVPMRTRKGVPYHYMTSNQSARNSVMAMIRDIITEGKRKHGKLAVVQLSAEEVEGKDGTFMVMRHEIIDWVDITKDDLPADMPVASSDEAPAKLAKPAAKKPAPVTEDDDGEEETVATPRKAPAKKAAPVVEEEEEDEAPAPVSRTPRKAAKAAPVEEEDDDVPAAPVKKPAPKAKRAPSIDMD